MAELSINLQAKEVRALLQLIRMRQDEYQQVDESCPTYKMYFAAEVKLELLKMKIAGQMP